MKLESLLKYAVTGTFILLILVLIFTQVSGQPAVVFVETGSMEPTLQPNDGYVAVPAMFVSDIEEGDVILFEAQEVGEGGLTTHRVVGEADRGYITKGDANPFTDQEGGEPPVTTGQVKAVGLRMNGDLVVIPGLGATVGAITAVTGTIQRTLFTAVGLESPGITTFSAGILVVGLLMLVYSLVAGSSDVRKRSRSDGSILRNGLVIVAILTFVVVIPVSFSMLLPSGVYQYDIVSSESPSEQQRVIQAGGSGEVTYFMRNSGHLPVLVFLEPASPGVDIPPNRTRTYIPRQTTVNTSVTLHAPDETGTYPRFVQEHRYIVLLPPSLITALHRVHPFLAFTGINAFVASVVIVVGVTSVGTGRVRLRSRNRDVTLRQELSRQFPFLARGTTGPESTPGASSTPRLDRRAGRERSRPSAPTPSQFHERAGAGGRDAAGRLTERQRAEVREVLARPPADVGLDEPEWTPGVLRTYLRRRYGVTYPEARCGALLHRFRTGGEDDAGPRPTTEGGE